MYFGLLEPGASIGMLRASSREKAQTLGHRRRAARGGEPAPARTSGRARQLEEPKSRSAARALSELGSSGLAPGRTSSRAPVGSRGVGHGPHHPDGTWEKGILKIKRSLTNSLRQSLLRPRTPFWAPLRCPWEAHKKESNAGARARSARREPKPPNLRLAGSEAFWEVWGGGNSW